MRTKQVMSVDSVLVVTVYWVLLGEREGEREVEGGREERRKEERGGRERGMEREERGRERAIILSYGQYYPKLGTSKREKREKCITP